MAEKACKNSINGTIVEAKNEIKNNKTRYFCSTPNCNVEMFLAAGESKAAYFFSKYHANHISTNCTRNNITFTPDKYTPKGFVFNDALEYMLGNREPLNIHISPTGKTQNNIGTGKEINPRTLKSIYNCFICAGINNSYGDVFCISDKLVCRDNISRYANGFNGIKICEFTFFKFDMSTQSFYINIPTLFHSKHLTGKLIVSDASLFQKIKKHFLSISKLQRHSELVVAIGDWKQSSDTGVDVECEIIRQKQIAYVK